MEPSISGWLFHIVTNPKYAPSCLRLLSMVGDWTGLMVGGLSNLMWSIRHATKVLTSDLSEELLEPMMEIPYREAS